MSRRSVCECVCVCDNPVLPGLWNNASKCVFVRRFVHLKHWFFPSLFKTQAPLICPKRTWNVFFPALYLIIFPLIAPAFALIDP